MSKMIFYTKEEDLFIKENYIKLGRTKCAEILNKTKGSIKSVAKRLGIKNSKEEIRLKQSQRRKNYNVNADLFMTNFTRESVYLLGLLWADGHLHIHKINTNNDHYRVTMQNLKSDAINFIEIFNTTGKWSQNIILNKQNNHEFINFSCANPILGSFLENNDYKIKSYTSPNKILSKIPEYLKHYFFQGYLDGDGCIYAKIENHKYMIMFTSTYEQDWNFLIDLCNKIDCNYSIQRRIRKNKNSKYSSFEIHGSKNCLIFANYIYNNKFELGLKRKYDKFLLIKEKTKELIKNKIRPWVNVEDRFLKILY